MTTRVERSHRVPGEYGTFSEGCDCYWHNRRFCFVGTGSTGRVIRADDRQLCLDRTITRVDPVNRARYVGPIFVIEAAVDGFRLRAERVAYHDPRNADGFRICYYAWVVAPIERLMPVPVGVARHQVRSVELRRANRAEWTSGRGDPNVLFELPESTGFKRWVIWGEAWWWRPELEPIDGPGAHEEAE